MTGRPRPGRRRATRLIVITAAFLLVASASFAQSRGRVVRDLTSIWRSDVSVIVAVVPAGTILDLVARSDQWYEVRIPEEHGAATQAAAAPERQPPTATTIRPPSPSGRRSEPAVAVRGFGAAGYTFFTARQSFEAIFGRSSGPQFGGGAQVRFRNGVFVQGSLDRFSRAGERVFVFEDTVFRLGIEHTLTLTPIAATAGYRFAGGRAVVPYLGGGLASYLVTQHSQFAAPEDDVNERRLGYQAVAGVELRGSRWVSLAAETQYAMVPEALGGGGVSEVFGENDLGGFRIQIKVLIGR